MVAVVCFFFICKALSCALTSLPDDPRSVNGVENTRSGMPFDLEVPETSDCHHFTVACGQPWSNAGLDALCYDSFPHMVLHCPCWDLPIHLILGLFPSLPRLAETLGMRMLRRLRPLPSMCICAMGPGLR
jgi:hypothetical protein